MLMPPLKIINETRYDGRSVAACARFVFRELDLVGENAVVKVKYHRGLHAYQGRFYANAGSHNAYVWDWRIGDYHEIAAKVPPGYRSLLVCRIGLPSIYPCQTHVYDRRDSPGTWRVEDWREALVSIVGHEAMHLKQYLTQPRGKRGRYNEVDTEWAAYRMWLRWRERRGG
jgi:hypothetical protein